MKLLRKRSVIFVFCFSIAVSAQAQNNIDSLRQLIRTTSFDSVKIKTYNHLALIYSQQNLTVSKQYADSALYEIAIAEKKTKSSYYEKQKGNSYNIIAHIAYQQGNFNEAIQQCLKTIKIFEKLNDTKNVSRVLNSIGIILKSIGNFKEAVVYLRKCVAIDEKTYFDNKNDEQLKMDLIGSYINLGSAYYDLNNYDSSLFYCHKSLALIDTSTKSEDLALIYINMGHTYRDLKKYPQAIYYTKKALDNYNSLSLPEGVSTAYISLSEAYRKMKKYDEALKYANLSVGINKTNSFNDDLLAVYGVIAQIYADTKDYKNESVFLKKHAELKDSLLKQNHAIQIEELKTQYETEKKEEEIVKLNNQNKIQDLQLQKNEETRKRFIITIVLITIIVLFLIGLAIFMQKIIKERKKAYLELQEKNIEIQHQSEKLSEQSKLIAKYQSQMNPHFMFNALNSIQGFVVNDQKEKTINQLQLFSGLMRETINNSEKENITLEKELNYLKTYLAFEQEKFSSKINFVLSIPENLDEILIPPMMIQPFIENAIKHAGFKDISNPEIALRIAIEEDLLHIKIIDNGLGFDTQEKSNIKNNHAVAIIKSRLKILFKASDKELPKNYFELISKPTIEHGTEVKFFIPLIYTY